MPDYSRNTIGTVKAVMGFVFTVVLLFALAKIVYLQRVQNLMIYSTPGMPFATVQAFLGEPTYTYSIEEWKRKQRFQSIRIPEGTKRIAEYSALSTYCYLFIGDNASVLGSFWYIT
jgi:hypothetical protein